MTDHDPTDSPATRIEVLGGGQVSPDELAALVVALTPTTDAVEAGDRPVQGPPAWARAALLEGVGLGVPTRPSDLARVTAFG